MSWVAIAFCSLLVMGLGNFFLKLASQTGISSFASIVIVFFTDAILAALIVLAKKPELFSSQAGLLWSVAGGICTGLGILLLIIAFGAPGSKTGVATAIMNANFALVALLGFFILKEALSIKQIMGLVAILAGMILLV